MRRIDAPKLGRRDQRVRHRAVTLTNRVGQVREDWHGLQPGLRRDLARRALEIGIHNPGLGIERQHGGAFAPLHRRHPDPQVLQPQRIVQGAVRVPDPGEEHRIDLSGYAEVALQTRQRREDRAHLSLLRLEGELAEAIRSEDTCRLEAQRPPDVLLLPVQRFDRDLRRLLHAGEQRVAWLRAELTGQGR